MAEKNLNEAIDRGVTFLDAVDVYSDGFSEKTIGIVLKSRKERVIAATKCGRRVQSHVNAGYTPQALERFVDDSLKRLGPETLDLRQLRCPPIEIYLRKYSLQSPV